MRFKIKRNGFKLNGFTDKHISDRNFTLNNELYEETDYEFGGIISMNDALREIKIERELSRTGLILPQRTIALYKPVLPFKNEDCVALIQKIETEFRADELCVIILLNLFFDIYGTNCEIDLKNSSFKFRKYALKRGFSIFNKKYSKLFFQIGQNIGSIYKKFHELGYTRGIGNSWYGNELICNDGSMGVCDLESCFSKSEIGNSDLFNELCSTDICLAKTAFYDSMNFFENSIASFVGVKLIEGFDIGYGGGNVEKLNPVEINKRINKFVKIRSKIVKND